MGSSMIEVGDYTKKQSLYQKRAKEKIKKSDDREKVGSR